MERPGNVTVHRSDGRVYEAPIGPGSGTHDPGPHTFTKIVPPESAVLHGRYTLAPGERHQSQIQPAEAPGGTDEKFPSQFAIIIIVYEDPETIPGWKSNTDCDETDLLAVKVTMRYYGTDSGFICQ